MFDIAWGEFVVIAVVALIVIGPKELPTVLRTIGQWTTKIRRMAAEFQGQFQEALREAEMADLKKEVEGLNDAAKGFTSQFDDPLNLKEATKWEPKPDDIKADDTAKPVAAPPSEPGTPAPPPGGGEGGEEEFSIPAERPAAERPIEQISAEQISASPLADAHMPSPPSVSQPRLPEGGGQRGSEGGVHS
jgi:sec-independent protein translocase protein TatB